MNAGFADAVAEASGAELDEPLADPDGPAPESPLPLHAGASNPATTASERASGRDGRTETAFLPVRAPGATTGYWPHIPVLTNPIDAEHSVPHLSARQVRKSFACGSLEISRAHASAAQSRLSFG